MSGHATDRRPRTRAAAKEAARTATRIKQITSKFAQCRAAYIHLGMAMTKYDYKTHTGAADIEFVRKATGVSCPDNQGGWEECLKAAGQLTKEPGHIINGYALRGGTVGNTQASPFDYYMAMCVMWAMNRVRAIINLKRQRQAMFMDPPAQIGNNTRQDKNYSKEFIQNELSKNITTDMKQRLQQYLDGECDSQQTSGLDVQTPPATQLHDHQNCLTAEGHQPWQVPEGQHAAIPDADDEFKANDRANAPVPAGAQGDGLASINMLRSEWANAI